MLKYGCSGLSWWKNADINMIESSRAQLCILFLSNGQSETRENTGRRKMRWSEKGKVWFLILEQNSEYWFPSRTSDETQESLLVDLRSEPQRSKEKGKSGCYWSRSRTPDEPPGVVCSATNELHRLFPFPLCFPASVLLKHAKLRWNWMSVQRDPQKTGTVKRN